MEVSHYDHLYVMTFEYQMSMRLLCGYIVILTFLFKTSTTTDLRDDLKAIFCLNKPTVQVYKYSRKTKDVYELCVKQPKMDVTLTVTARFDDIHRYPFLIYFASKDTCPISDASTDIVMFPEDEFVFLTLNNHNWKLAGFSQVWLGCPPPFCFMAEMDVVVDSYDLVYITRANHLCKINIRAIANKLILNPNNLCERSEAAFFDYGIRLETDVYLFKDKSVFNYGNNGTFKKQWKFGNEPNPELKKQFEKVANMKIDSAFANSHTSFYLTDNNLVMFDNNGDDENILIDAFFSDVDIAFFVSLRELVYFIKKDIVYSIPLSWTQTWIYKNETEKVVKFNRNGPVFTHFFSCGHFYAKTFLKNYRGFENYRNRFLEVGKHKGAANVPLIPMFISLVLLAGIALLAYKIGTSLWIENKSTVNTLDTKSDKKSNKIEEKQGKTGETI